MRCFAIVGCLFALLVCAIPADKAEAGGGRAARSKYDNTAWVRLWARRDHSLAQSIRVASATFGVSEAWLRACNRDEGGNVARWKLAVSLRRGYGPGWNNRGSSAFGPFQFMLDDRPPDHSGEWGTFGRYDDAAFRAARARRVNVPMRFKRPDSFVGQALTAAYMFKTGEADQWQGAGC